MFTEVTTTFYRHLEAAVTFLYTFVKFCIQAHPRRHLGVQGYRIRFVNVLVISPTLCLPLVRYRYRHEKQHLKLVILGATLVHSKQTMSMLSILKQGFLKLTKSCSIS